MRRTTPEQLRLQATTLAALALAAGIVWLIALWSLS